MRFYLLLFVAVVHRFDFTLLAVIITLNTLDHKLLRAHGRSKGVPSVFCLLPFPEFVLTHGCDDAFQKTEATAKKVGQSHAGEKIV